MTFQNGLKAGGIGAVIAVILNLIAIIPLVGFCTFILTLVLWIGVGVLAGYFGSKSNSMQTGGDAAKAGAVAGAVTSLVGGVAQTIIQTITFAIQTALGVSVQALSQIPPEQLRQLREAGVDPAIFSSVAGAIGVGSCCCIIGTLIAAALGAGGGALSPSFFKRNP
jgi:hypothetical protein